MSLLAHQLRAEQLVFWRSREAAVFIFIFPPMLFLLLGSVYDGTIEGHPAADVLLAGMIAYGVANTAFAGLTIQLVVRRESGVLKRLRSTPLPTTTYLTAVLTSTLLVFVLQMATIIVLGRFLFDTAVPTEWLSLAVTVLIGVLSFAGLGVGLASLIKSAEGSSAIVNVVLLPMAFLSGSFGPTRDYPRALQALADVLPLTYLIETLKGVLLEHEQAWEHLGALAVVLAWGLVGLVVALKRFSWEPRER